MCIFVFILGVYLCSFKVYICVHFRCIFVWRLAEDMTRQMAARMEELGHIPMEIGLPPIGSDHTEPDPISRPEHPPLSDSLNLTL